MLKRNLFFLFSILLITAASTMLCIFNYNPYSATVNQFILFYLSLILLFGSLFSLCFFYAKIYFFHKEIVYSLFWPSVRQGVILSLAISVLIVLRGMRLLDIWTGAPLFMAVIFSELFFQTKRKVHSEKR